MSNCFCCKHRGALVNQGVHWCELQVGTYPDIGDCEHYESECASITSVECTLSSICHNDCRHCDYYIAVRNLKEDIIDGE